MALSQSKLNSSSIFRSHPGMSLANGELPARVVASEGKLTIYADFVNAGKEGVPLYLVNRTGNTVSLAMQDQDLYFKLEHKNAKGVWERAQAHLGAPCGNSYHSAELPDGRFFRFMGYTASEGKMAKVRYSTGDELISNEGEAMVSEVDVEEARYDSLAALRVPYEIRQRLAFEENGPRTNIFSNDSRVAALRLAKVYGNNDLIKRHVLKMAAWLSDPKRKPSEDALKAVAEMRKILKTTWPVDGSAKRLREYCFEALLTGDGDGALKDHRELMLLVLGNMARTDFGDRRDSLPGLCTDTTEDWKPMVDVARKVIQSGSDAERKALIQWLNVSVLVDEKLRSELVEAWRLAPEGLAKGQ